MIGPAGFMQSPAHTRQAWCAKCADVQPCDDDGCITCRIEQRNDRARRAATAKRRRDRLKGDGFCITSDKHPRPAWPSVRCDKCAEVHRRSR